MIFLLARTLKTNFKRWSLQHNGGLLGKSLLRILPGADYDPFTLRISPFALRISPFDKLSPICVNSQFLRINFFNGINFQRLNTGNPLILKRWQTFLFFHIFVNIINLLLSLKNGWFYRKSRFRFHQTLFFEGETFYFEHILFYFVQEF